jgi:hypothetical protein
MYVIFWVMTPYGLVGVLKTPAATSPMAEASLKLQTVRVVTQNIGDEFWENET